MRGGDADDQGSDVLPRVSGYDCSKNYWPPDSAACSAEVVYTRLNKDKIKEILDINPINTDAVRPKG